MVPRVALPLSGAQLAEKQRHQPAVPSLQSKSLLAPGNLFPWKSNAQHNTKKRQTIT